MFHFITYIKFLLASTNQHGVHSPFVYQFVTQCLYTKHNYKGSSKSIKVLLKSIEYFGAKKIHIAAKDDDIKNRVLEEFDAIEFNNPPYDLVYMDRPTSNFASDYAKNNGHIHNNTMVLINSIHQNKTSSELWENIKAMEQVRVTIDMFYCGAVFFRKEQAKEHFKIRI